MTTYYEKRGRRYHPVREYDNNLMDSLPKGAHLIVTTPGHQSTRYNVVPEHAPLLAALRMHRNRLANLMIEAGKARPAGNRMLSEKEQKAVAAYYSVMGKEAVLSFEWPSFNEILDKLEKALVEAAHG